jgi:chromosome segregation ATPase
MSEGNGQQESGNERLDRIERALELILNDHIEFRAEHKLLLSAQVQMQGGLEELRQSTSDMRKDMSDLRKDISDLRTGLDDLRSTVGVLATNVEAMRQNFDERLKRLESPRVQ